MSGRATLRLAGRGCREHFLRGFQNLGYDVIQDHQPKFIKPEDVLVLWNRNPPAENIARVFEESGATVLIAENGYIGCDNKGQKLVALSKSHHNGVGSWNYLGKPSRDIELEPWKRDGDCILVLPQRGIGERGVAMPAGWDTLLIRKLEKINSRKIILKSHPGTLKQDLEPYFENCWAAITWGSGAAIKALAYGIPVFYQLPKWIGAQASCFGDGIENRVFGDRESMFTKLSWAQWELDRIESGEALEFILKEGVTSQ